MKNILLAISVFLSLGNPAFCGQEDKVDAEIRRLMENKYIGQVPAVRVYSLKKSDWKPSGGLQLERIDFVRVGLELAEDMDQDRLEKFGLEGQVFNEKIVPLKRYKVTDRKKYVRSEALKGAFLPGILIGAMFGGAAAAIRVSHLDLKMPPGWSLFSTKQRLGLLGKWAGWGSAAGALTFALIEGFRASNSIQPDGCVYRKDDAIKTRSIFAEGQLFPEKPYWNNY